MIVTIDGPAGAGKSSVARSLAERLQFRFLDTGAMYRAVALVALEQGLDWNDAAAIAALAQRLDIDVRGSQTLVDGRDVSEAIRTPAVTAVTRYAADNPQVRQRLVALQRQAAGDENLVTEGRDQGTVVFPDARCKIYLTASAAERARRRHRDFAARGEELSLEEVLSDQYSRDERDAARDVGPLVVADDALIVVTDDMSPEEVVEHLESLVRQRMEK